MSLLIAISIVLATTALIADFHADWYKANKPIYWWWHPLWVSPFVIFSVIYSMDHNIWYGIISFSSHALFFAQLLNLFRGPKFGFFYISNGGPNPSLTDTILIKIKPIYPYLWFIAFVSYITILILVLSNIIHL